MALPRWMRVALGALALAAAYAAIYRLVVLGTTFGTSAGATFWPASGVTVSVLILRERREWPAYLVAIWIADFLMDTHGGGGYSARVSCGLASANCAEPLLAATLLRRTLGAPPIEHGEVTVKVSASVGYTLCTEHHERPEDVLSRADHEMYRVKRSRRVATAVALPD